MQQQQFISIENFVLWKNGSPFFCCHHQQQQSHHRCRQHCHNDCDHYLLFNIDFKYIFVTKKKNSFSKYFFVQIYTGHTTTELIHSFVSAHSCSRKMQTGKMFRFFVLFSFVFPPPPPLLSFLLISIRIQFNNFFCFLFWSLVKVSSSAIFSVSCCYFF